jgi:hypothetical protein
MKEIKLRPYALDICELFKDILDEHDITIPDENDDERGEDNSARLYGMTYANLEDSVVSILHRFASEIDLGCKVKLIDSY